MTLLAENSHITKVADMEFCESVISLRSLIDHQNHIAVLLHEEPSCHEEWELLEKIHESVCVAKGQFISLNILDFGEATLPGILNSALEYSQTAKSFRINLPIILQNNPHTESPFINRAILWQRLCDRIIADEDQRRPTVLILENIDQASPRTQHDAARLIRFHLTHRIRRSFLLTLKRNNLSLLVPELREFLSNSQTTDAN